MESYTERKQLVGRQTFYFFSAIAIDIKVQFAINFLIE